jgi:hypothetical protein
VGRKTLFIHITTERTGGRTFMSKGIFGNDGFELIIWILIIIFLLSIFFDEGID